MTNKYFADMVNGTPVKAVFSFNGVDKDIWFKSKPRSAAISNADEVNIVADEKGKGKAQLNYGQVLRSQTVDLVAVTCDEAGNAVFGSYEDLASMPADFVEALYDCYSKATEKKQ